MIDMNPCDSHLFALADTFGMTLYYDSGLEEADASIERTVKLGPWTGNAKVRLITDFVTAGGAGALVKLRKALYAYALTFKSGDTRRIMMILFDGKAAGLRTGEMRKFLTGDPAKTMDKVKPYIGAAFEFINNEWVPADVADLDGQVLQ